MKILLFHQHFNTPEGGGAIRSYYLATALANAGHQVVMITSSGDRTSRTAELEGIKVVYLPIPYKNRFKFYTRSWAFIKFVIAAIWAASKYKDYDRCYGISTPLTVGLCTMWMKFRYGIPYILEVGDLWPDVPIQLGYVSNPLFKRILFSLEKAIYRRADSIVALSPTILTTVESKIPGKVVHLIPNMADCEFYHPEGKMSQWELKYNTTGKLVVSYIGSIGAANGLNYLVDCAKLCFQEKLPVQFIICGDGAMLDELKQLTTKNELRNVTFTGLVNRNAVREVMNVTDAVFVSYRNVPIMETGSPNKYFDGLAGGKMIIINFGGWIRKEVEETGCGLYVDPADPNDFLQKLRPFQAQSELMRPLQQSSRKLAEKKYSRKLLSDSFAKLF